MVHAYQYIDLSYLDDISDGNDGIRNDLIGIFLEQLPEFTQGMVAALADSDWKGLAALAHKAKSSVLSMGMAEHAESNLKNIELIGKQLYINEHINSSTDVERMEAEKLLKAMQLYPADKQAWVQHNANINELKQLINRFVVVCQLASDELNQVVLTK